MRKEEMVSVVHLQLRMAKSKIKKHTVVRKQESAPFDIYTKGNK